MALPDRTTYVLHPSVRCVEVCTKRVTAPAGAAIKYPTSCGAIGNMVGVATRAVNHRGLLQASCHQHIPSLHLQGQFNHKTRSHLAANGPQMPPSQLGSTRSPVQVRPAPPRALDLCHSS
ncbi:hypothetical protein HPB51_016274 [Rhipicephalus microplus]|uniref:Uncharacterized protein n=1 Tax=Rhipicephalus microplus TaxID=6941 RepID=A0A9J6ETS3_RHIMP|nr:hypothetical protein HPB51_016274 [Rhipicephalus microplus]